MVERETVGGLGSSRVGDGISFFITNIPDDANSAKLWGVFAKFGRVGDVYIPKKVDKRGKRFGFVNFKVMEDLRELESLLNDVWIGTYKLRINRARFSKADVGSKPAEGGRGSSSGGKGGFISSGNSFRTALQGRNEQCLGGTKGNREEVMEVPLEDGDFLKELSESYVGVLKYAMDVSRIKTTIYMEGLQDISVREMGGGMVLLHCAKEEVLKRLITDKADWVQFYFKDCHPWSQEIVAVKREVWVQVHGIPLHIWGERFFRMVAAKAGSFIDFDEATASRASFNLARIKICTSRRSLIDEELKISVQGAIFNVWMIEERVNVASGLGARSLVEEERSWVASSVFSGAVVEEGEMEHGFSGEEVGSDGTEGSQISTRLKKDDGDGSRTFVERVDNALQLSANNMGAFEEVGTCREVGSGTELGERATVPREGDKSAELGECAEEDMCATRTVPDLLVGQEREDVGFVKEVSLVREETDFFFGPGSSKTSRLGPVGSPSSGAGFPRQFVNSEGFSDPLFSDKEELGLVRLAFSDPLVVQKGEPLESRRGVVRNCTVVSSLSDEDVSRTKEEELPVREKFLNSKKGVSRQIVHQLGKPKCLQFAEAVSKVGDVSRRKKVKGSKVQGGSMKELGSVRRNSTQEKVVGTDEIQLEVVLPSPRLTPPSGVNLIFSDEDRSNHLLLSAEDEEGEFFRESTVLIQAQKAVGFSFKEADGDSQQRLVSMEKRDRRQKVEREATGVQ
ncbi:unnamed protein product [Trifolium pratense]|uniref:Uncharacterized protein n=1 Tax=Trifolium pratense TaxID=57577 RepID=A0ACB0M3H6_TRIPR|nr:unnamed protein product [Trifolium pratense]